MAQYEYKVVPAPAKAQKAKGVKTAEGRFAHTVEAELNRLAAEGWEYQRAELLPHDERSGLTATQTTWRTMLVFRRAVAEAQPRVLDIPAEAPVLPPVVPADEDAVAEPPLTSDETIVPLHAAPPAEDDTPAR